MRVHAAKYFYHREFSFTIDDTYIRYQSFRNETELRKKLRSMRPHKIDIGAVYTLPVRSRACECGARNTETNAVARAQQAEQHNSVQKETFQTVERELVFDIDLTDYDPVRTCCSGATICRRCWQFMTVAVKVMDRTLRGTCGGGAREPGRRARRW